MKMLRLRLETFSPKWTGFDSSPSLQNRSQKWSKKQMQKCQSGFKIKRISLFQNKNNWVIFTKTFFQHSFRKKQLLEYKNVSLTGPML